MRESFASYPFPEQGKIRVGETTIPIEEPTPFPTESPITSTTPEGQGEQLFRCSQQLRHMDGDYVTFELLLFINGQNYYLELDAYILNIDYGIPTGDPEFGDNFQVPFCYYTISYFVDDSRLPENYERNGRSFTLDGVTDSSRFGFIVYDRHTL